MVPFDFCEDELTSYEKTVYALALAYGYDPIYSLNDTHIEKLAYFLELNFDKLKKALSVNDGFMYKNAAVRFGSDTVTLGGFFKNDFFDVMIKICFAYDALENAKCGNDKETIAKNIEIFSNVYHYFEMANSKTATYECMHENMFSYKYTVFDSPEDFSPSSSLDMLKMLLNDDFRSIYDESLPSMLSLILKCEFKTRINALYIITLCQIFKHPPCVDSEISDIAEGLYQKLLFILKNGRIVAVNANLLYSNTKRPVSERSRSDDTTRLQILYGYSNYDCYELRLDFSHQGQEFIHLNNESPGKIASGIFTAEEYAEITEKYPSSEKLFIAYGARFALKERSNCELENREAKDMYEDISGLKAHEAVFTQDYSEVSVNTFIEYMARMLPKECRKPIDATGGYADKCFNYDKLMEAFTVLYIACLRHPEYVDRVTEKIKNDAYRYGYISDEEKEIITSVGDIVSIVLRAENTLKNFK